MLNKKCYSDYYVVASIEPWRRGIEACVEESSLRRAMPSRLDVEPPMGVEPVTTLRRIEASSLDVEGGDYTVRGTLPANNLFLLSTRA